jgi:hypothetical protein
MDDRVCAAAHELFFSHPLVLREHRRGFFAIRVSERHFCKMAGIFLRDLPHAVASINRQFSVPHRVTYDYCSVTKDVIVMW